MKRPLPYPEARRILGKVAAPNSFWLCTNDNLRSLAEIAETLGRVDDDVFRYHVTRDKNDFEVWIRDTLKDKELAREIARVKTKETLIRKINERVDALRRVANRHLAVLNAKRKLRKLKMKARKAKGRKSKKRKTAKKRTGRKSSKYPGRAGRKAARAARRSKKRTHSAGKRRRRR